MNIAGRGIVYWAIVSAGWTLSAVLIPAAFGWGRAPIDVIAVYIPVVAASFAWGVWINVITAAARASLRIFIIIFAEVMVLAGVPAVGVYFAARAFL